MIGNKGKQNPFDLTRTEWNMQPLKGTMTSSTGTWLRTLDNVVTSVQQQETGHYPLSTPPSNGAIMASLLAKTNPSRPIVDLPVFISELRELPELVQFTGKTLLKRGAGAYLSYEFGWKPLIGDLMSLLDFQSHFDKRAEELSNIFQKGGVKRRRDLWDETRVSSQSTIVLSSINGTLRTRRAFIGRRRIWATCRWVPDPNRLPPRTSKDMRRLARKAVLGLQLEPATLWQAMPWSWMIDWFSSAGDFFEANRNCVPAMHLQGCVMTMRETYRTDIREPGIDSFTGQVSGGSGTQYVVTKQRRVQNNPTIDAYFPFLNRRQVSILGALSVVRGRHKVN